MADVTSAGEPPADRLQLTMLREIYDLGLAVAGDVWPTPEMALSRLFERGAVFLDGAGMLPPISRQAAPGLRADLDVLREDLLLVEALYVLTRHVTFTLTQEGQVLEADWLERADRHLAIRDEIVKHRREEERLKRELSALGGVTVPLPEHDDLPPLEAGRARKSRGMYEHLFDGASAVHVQLQVSEPIRVQADRVIQARGWAEEWGEHARLLILTHGISLAQREREADAIDGDDDASVQAAQEAARSRLMGLEGRYSTLRRRLFELRHNNRILRWRITALEVEAQGMRSRLDQFLADRDRLEQAIDDLRAAGARPAEPPPATDPPRGWRQRLARLFGANG